MPSLAMIRARAVLVTEIPAATAATRGGNCRRSPAVIADAASAAWMTTPTLPLCCAEPPTRSPAPSTTVRMPNIRSG